MRNEQLSLNHAPSSPQTHPTTLQPAENTMKRTLHPCPECNRHVDSGATSCPFCASDFADTAQNDGMPSTLSRRSAGLLTLGALVSACSPKPKESKQLPPPEDPAKPDASGTPTRKPGEETKPDSSAKPDEQKPDEQKPDEQKPDEQKPDEQPKPLPRPEPDTRPKPKYGMPTPPRRPQKMKYGMPMPPKPMPPKKKQ